MFLSALADKVSFSEAVDSSSKAAGHFISPSKIFATYQELQRLLSVQAALGKLAARNSGAA